METSISAKPARTASRARARSKAPESEESTSSSAEASVSSGPWSKRRPLPVPSEGSTRAKASSAGWAWRASPSASVTMSATPSVPTTPARLAVATASPTMTTTLTSRARCTPFVVVVLRAKRTSAWLPSCTRTTQPSAPPLDAAARPASTTSWAGITGRPGWAAQAGRRAQRPDSARALSTLTPRTRTEGQPCETGATCPGCPLPQLNAPPSTQVDAPPTASMAPQKSVVVAW